MRQSTEKSLQNVKRAPKETSKGEVKQSDGGGGWVTGIVGEGRHKVSAEPCPYMLMTSAYSLNPLVRLCLLRMQGSEEGHPWNGGLSSVWGCVIPRERLVKAGCQVFPSGGRESVAMGRGGLCSKAQSPLPVTTRLLRN